MAEKEDYTKDKGDTGDTGPQGEQGIQGEEGPTGPAGTTDYGELENVPETFAPSAHKASHQDGGADEINVNGLMGVLIEEQPSAGGDTSVLEINLLLNAYRIAVNGTLTAFRLVKGWLDAFYDETGVDTATSTGESYDAGGDYYEPTGAALETTWSDTLTYDAQWSTMSGRQVCGAASISTSGDQIRVTVEAAHAVAGQGLILDHVAIVERSGSTANGTTTPTEILFGGTSGVTIAQNTEEVSDWLSYALNETKDYLLIADVTDDSGNDALRITDSGGDGTYNSPGTDSYNTQNMGGSATFVAGRTVIFNKMEVGGEAEDMTLVSDAVEAEANPGTVRVVFLEEDVDAITLNTDAKGWASRDDGASWAQATLTDAGDYETDKRVLTGEADVSGQAADKIVRWKFSTHNTKALKLHGAGYLLS